MKAVIMAGGRGSRLGAITADVPKPMLKIAGIPVLEHQIRSLRRQGFSEIFITVSHLASVIMDYFGDGSSFGVHITYFVEKVPLGNAGALFLLREQLDDDFLLLNADVMFGVDLGRFAAYHRKKGGLVTLFTHPNSHPYDSGLMVADRDGAVEQWIAKEDARPRYYKNRVNAGLHILNPAVLDMAQGMQRENFEQKSESVSVPRVDLDRQILRPLAGSGRMFCYDSPEYVKDMGTPDRYESVCADYQEGKVKAKNLKNKQKAVFLDRDGTINQNVGFLRNIDEFELIPGVAEAVKWINKSGYLAIVITNQPVIARGEVTYEQLQEIHNKMETLLGVEGAYLDAIYYCPHHPHKGYEGEVPELKIECECRKPKPGMLFRAAEDFNIDLCQSWMVGDSKNDIKAGRDAGCRTAFLGKTDYSQDVTIRSLEEFVYSLD